MRIIHMVILPSEYSPWMVNIILLPDTTVESNYIETVVGYFNENQVGATVVGFQHSIIKNTTLENSIREYEKPNIFPSL